MVEAKKWDHKIKAANEYFAKWETRFRCKTIDDYFDGFQDLDGYSSNSYVLNLFESTFAIKEPSLLFKKPIFYVDPRPTSSNEMPSQAYEWATNATDLLNTIVGAQETGVASALEMAVIDARSYFGIIEVQFKTDWIKNPSAGKPIINFNELTGEEETLEEVEPDKLVTKEWFEVKRIPAHRFRVGGNDCSTLEEANWCGYYEFFRLDELKKNENFKNVSSINFGVARSDDYFTEYNEDENQIELQGDLIKVWKIWDNLSKTFLMVTEDKVVIFEEEFERLPLFALRFKKRRKGWYPVPYAFSWIPPQDEINETRNQVRSARRRAKRVWTLQDGAMESDEIEKVVNGPDGTVALRKTQTDMLTPVQYPPLDASIGLVLQVSKDDFNNISGTSAEQRGQSDRTTATQATIIDQRATIRDNREREIVAEWVCSIGMEILKQSSKMTLPYWTKVSHDVGSFGMDVTAEEEWKQLTAQDLGSIDYQVSITVESLSPVANDQEKRKFMEFLAIFSQYPLIATHPDLVMEAAFKVGYKNLKVIKAFQQAAIMQMTAQAAGMEQQGNPNDNMAQQTTQQMIPNTQTQIQNQLDRVGVEQ